MAVKVDPTTVAMDSFMLNMQAILLRFAEPFMDVNYTISKTFVGNLNISISSLDSGTCTNKKIICMEHVDRLYGSC